MKQRNTLIFFTLEFPYGKKSETFIENEIKYLSESFDKVIILPRQCNSQEIRPLPENVEVNDLLLSIKSEKKYLTYILGSFARFYKVLQIYLYTLFYDKKRVMYLKSGYFLFYLGNALKEVQSLEPFIEKSNFENAIYYDYWFVNSTLSLSILKSHGKIHNLYCRAHGFDVFNERWLCGTVPFREYIFKQVNKVVAISEYNKNYMIKELRNQTNEVEVSYLGVREVNAIKKTKNLEEKKKFVIVSCANLLPFKQVERIPKVLKHLGKENIMIKWIHFGDGPNEFNLLNAAKQLPQNVTLEYMGHVKNQEVLHFYASNNVDLFLSLSLKEGLPVSMMEAQGFGIPIMGYNIFGIPEIINNTTGILLELEMKDEDIAKKITEMIENKLQFDQMEIRNFFLQKFSAKSNYKSFVKILLNNA
jgi:glycosyltransferase involved in cell wall biosynthesis